MSARHDCASQGSSAQPALAQKGRQNCGCEPYSSPTSWPSSTRGASLAASNDYFKQLPSDPKLRTESPVVRETCFVNTSATLFALSTFCSRPRLHRQQSDINVLQTTRPLTVCQLQSRRAVSPNERRLSRETLFHQKRVYSHHVNCRISHGIHF